jgi:DNA-directed RNA polymerase subunit RPC12/RpoP
MKTYTEWKNLSEAIEVACKNCGQKLHAPDDAHGRKGRCPKCGSTIDIVNPQQSQQQPQQAPAQFSLSSLGEKIADHDWHALYDVFVKQFKQFPSDPKVQQLGLALKQAGESGNMSGLESFKKTHIYAQPVH